MRNSKLILTIGLMATIVSLVGCAGKIRYPSYYILNVPSVVPATQSAPILGSVAVREFDAPRFLREGPIAYRPSAEQLDLYDYHRWAEDPRRVVTTAIVQQIRARGIFQSVDVFDGRASSECLLTGTVDHLEEVDHGTNVSIEVTLSARLINLRTGEVLWQDTSSQTAKLDQRSVAGIVAEMSQDLASAVGHLVSSVQDHLTVASSSQSRLNSDQ
jgi:ABC-type uncharacterized transport system auxiliary subunit